jgi:lipid II:glycine glycyltransferase (peptidoglycan interpeptide bridge formation enzyme)
MDSFSQNEFLQSDYWRKFQESVGRRTFHITSPQPSPYKGEGEIIFSASVIEHELPIVGKYFYVPRGPIIVNPKSEIPASPARLAAKRAGRLNPKPQVAEQGSLRGRQIQNSFSELIALAKKNNAGWIRIEPADKELRLISEAKPRKFRGFASIQKAPHDMQPREILVIDITKPEEQLLSEMKPKTRYNIKLSQKHNVSVKVLTNNQQLTTNNYFDKFIRLVKITAERDKITPHPESYYRKMFETIPGDILKLYVAEYNSKVIAANIVIHYGDTATYLHGASDNEARNVMAPYILQWQAILDAKKAGLKRYDLGGVKLTYNLQPTTNNWQGITRFKTSFSPVTLPIVFPGSYDIVINSFRYNLYRVLQKIRGLV